MLKAQKLVCVALAGMLVVAFWLTSCAPQQPIQQYTIRIGTLNTPDSLPCFVIQDRGLDKKYGLHLVETTFAGGAAIIEALAADKLDVGVSVGTPPILSAAERSMIPGKIVPAAAIDFADPEHPMIGVLVSPSISTWKDLSGKQVGVNALVGLNAVGIKGRLQIEGVTDYKMVEIPFANMGLALAGGNIDAATLTEPYLTQSLQRKDGKFLGWIVGGPPLENIEYTAIVFSANYYRDNPQTVKAFLRAHLEAANWIEQNPDDARSILGKKLGLTPAVMQKIGLPRFSLDGHNDPALLENMQQTMVSVGMLKALIAASQLYDETLLDEALKEKR